MQDAQYGAGTVDKMRKIEYNKSADKAQFEAYQSRLGADAPKTFEAFQTLKYDNPETYKELCGYYRYKGNNPNSNKQFYNANKAVQTLRETNVIRAQGTVTVAPKGRTILEIKTHASERMAERGISQEYAQSIIDNAVFALKQRKGTQYVYYTSNGFAALDDNGVLMSTGALDDGGKKLLDEVMKNVTNRK